MGGRLKIGQTSGTRDGMPLTPNGPVAVGEWLCEKVTNTAQYVSLRTTRGTGTRTAITGRYSGMSVNNTSFRGVICLCM